MNKVLHNRPLRHFSILAVTAILTISAGCSGEFTSGGGRVQDNLSKTVNGETGTQTLSLARVPVEVHVEGSTLIFDFSNVDEPGVLSTLDSGGYLFGSPELPTVWGASIDPESTNADLAGLVIQLDGHGVTVNFDDLEYDGDTFIKIDLRFAEAT